MIKTMLPIALTLATLNPINANVNSNNTNSNIDFTSRSIISEIQNNPNVIIKEKEEKTPEKPEVTVELNKSQIKEVNGIELVVYDITDIFNKFKEEYKDKDLEVKVKEEAIKKKEELKEIYKSKTEKVEGKDGVLKFKGEKGKIYLVLSKENKIDPLLVKSDIDNKDQTNLKDKEESKNKENKPPVEIKPNENKDKLDTEVSIKPNKDSNVNDDKEKSSNVDKDKNNSGQRQELSADKEKANTESSKDKKDPVTIKINKEEVKTDSNSKKDEKKPKVDEKPTVIKQVKADTRRNEATPKTGENHIWLIVSAIAFIAGAIGLFITKRSKKDN